MVVRKARRTKTVANEAELAGLTLPNVFRQIMGPQGVEQAEEALSNKWDKELGSLVLGGIDLLFDYKTSLKELYAQKYVDCFASFSQVHCNSPLKELRDSSDILFISSTQSSKFQWFRAAENSKKNCASSRPFCWINLCKRGDQQGHGGEEVGIDCGFNK